MKARRPEADGRCAAIAVNLIGTFNMIGLAAEAMCGNAPEPTGECGVIVDTASVATHDGQIGLVAYPAPAS